MLSWVWVWTLLSSISNSRILISNLLMAALPAFMAAASASAMRVSSSLIWVSRARFPRLSAVAWSCSERSSSARRAASTMGVQGALSTALGSGVVLFRAEFIGKAGSIDHGPLGLLLRVLGLSQHVVNLSLESVDHALNVALLMHSLGVDD